MDSMTSFFCVCLIRWCAVGGRLSQEDGRRKGEADVMLTEGNETDIRSLRWFFLPLADVNMHIHIHATELSELRTHIEWACTKLTCARACMYAKYIEKLNMIFEILCKTKIKNQKTNIRERTVLFVSQAWKINLSNMYRQRNLIHSLINRKCTFDINRILT